MASIFHPQQQTRQLAHQDYQTDSTTLRTQNQLPPKSQYYGNLIILYHNHLHFSIGPDYCFSIVALFFLGGFAYGMYMISYLVQFGNIGWIMHYLFTFLPSVCFLVTGLSNPGVYQPDQNFQPKRKYLMVKVFIPRKVYHCKYCNVCIQEYDHHCPWLSKCVGKKNIFFFHCLLASISLSFLYFFYLLYLVITSQDHNHK